VKKPRILANLITKSLEFIQAGRLDQLDPSNVILSSIKIFLVHLLIFFFF